MKATIENTSKIVTLIVNGCEVPARIWQGETECGVLFHCYITRVAVDLDSDAAQFERELMNVKTPRADIEAIPLRLVL